MSQGSKYWKKRAVALTLMLLLAWVFIPLHSVSATTAWQNNVHVANDQIGLWLAVLAMGSLVLLGLVWVLWPERRRYDANQ